MGAGVVVEVVEVAVVVAEVVVLEVLAAEAAVGEVAAVAGLLQLGVDLHEVHQGVAKGVP